jgi:hypothetical protein
MSSCESLEAELEGEVLADVEAADDSFSAGLC